MLNIPLLAAYNSNPSRVVSAINSLLSSKIAVALFVTKFVKLLGIK
jgi:hypothetical protein